MWESRTPNTHTVLTNRWHHHTHRQQWLCESSGKWNIFHAYIQTVIALSIKKTLWKQDVSEEWEHSCRHRCRWPHQNCRPVRKHYLQMHRVTGNELRSDEKGSNEYVWEWWVKYWHWFSSFTLLLLPTSEVILPVSVLKKYLTCMFQTRRWDQDWARWVDAFRVFCHRIACWLNVKSFIKVNNYIIHPSFASSCTHITSVLLR